MKPRRSSPLTGANAWVRYLLDHPEAETACVDDVSVDVREMQEGCGEDCPTWRGRTHQWPKRPSRGLPTVHFREVFRNEELR